MSAQVHAHMCIAHMYMHMCVCAWYTVPGVVDAYVCAYVCAYISQEIIPAFAGFLIIF